MAGRFDFFCKDLDYHWCKTHSITSMEQLWLAFVMKEKHGKTWDGNQWELVCLG